MRPLLRLGLRIAGIALVLVLAAVLSSPWWFDARRVTDLALAQADSATGLTWACDGEPALRWRPKPWLSLPGLTARDDAGRAVLAVERLEIAVPWATLRGESLQVDTLRLDAPEVDLDAALAWWDAQPAGDGADLPRLHGLTVTRGRVRWNGGALQELEASLPRLAPGEPMALSLRGQWVGAPTNDPTPLTFALQWDARPMTAPLRFEDLSLQLQGTGPIPTMVARGRLQVVPWAFDAVGEMAAWPPAWPALPPPIASSPSPLAFTLEQRGASALAAETRLSIQRDSNAVDIEGRPEAMLAWLDDANAATLPPLRLNAVLPDVSLDGVQLEGVTVELDEEATPTGESLDVPGNPQ